MTCTTATNSTSGQVIYLPTPQSNNILNNSWITSTSTSTWTQSSLVFDENGSKIVDQISKVQAFITKYKNMINGAIYVELIEKLNNLLHRVNCIWGIGNFVGYSNLTGTTTATPTWIQTTTQTYPTTWGQYTTSGNSWIKLDNSTTAATTGITYIY